MDKQSKKPRSNSMRRFLRDVLKPSPALSTLGKRERIEDQGDLKGSSVGRTEPSFRASMTTASTACIALQNEDPLEDAVVITALSVAPFCCHADLITMSRTQLLTVAAILNAKLPRALQIDVGPSCSDVAIRYAIEVLVGLRDNPLYPPQPAPSTSRFTMVYGTPLRAHSQSQFQSPTPRRTPACPSPSPRPASPLAQRSRHSISLGSPALPILHEDAREREDPSPPASSAKPEPPQKKRRTDAPITRALSHRIAPFLASAHSEEEGTDSPCPRPRERSGVPLTRTLTTMAEASPKKMARPVRAKSLRAYMTSTPKTRRFGRAEAAVNSPGVARRRFASLLADATDQDVDAGVSRAEREPEARRVVAKLLPEDTAFLEKTMDTTVVGASLEAGEDETTASVSVKVEELDSEVTFGLDEVTMPIAGTDGEVERSDADVVYV